MFLLDVEESVACTPEPGNPSCFEEDGDPPVDSLRGDRSFFLALLIFHVFTAACSMV